MSKISTRRTRRLHRASVAVCVIFFALCIAAGTISHDQFREFSLALIIGYLALTVARNLFFFSGAILDIIEHRNLKSIKKEDLPQPMVTVILPAYNEEDVIEASIRSLIALEYFNYEVIVVNDGSTDNTEQIARVVAMNSPYVPVHVISQTNSGKAAALNLGLNHAVGELVMCVDADSRLHPQSIDAGVRHFIDGKVGAVAGFVEVSNKVNLLTYFQQLEYLVGLNFLRRALSVLGVVPIVPGPAGLFRREALLDGSGYHSDVDIFAEDAELSMRLVANGWKIKSEEDLLAYTEAPEEVMPLLRQRFRWYRGTFQAYRENMDDLWLRSGWRGMLLGIHLMLEINFIAVVNFGFLLMFLSHLFVWGEGQLAVSWMIGIFCIEAVKTTLVTIRHGELLKWIGVMMLSQFTYSLLLLNWRIISLFEEWYQTNMSWDKLDRTGDIEIRESA